MKQMDKIARLGVLFLVSGLLIGHGATIPTRKAYARIVRDSAKQEFDLSQETPVRRFKVALESRNYQPRDPIWEEQLIITDKPQSQILPLRIRVLDSSGHVYYDIDNFRGEAVDGRTRIFAFAHSLSANSSSSRPPNVSCVHKLCRASRIIELRLKDPTTGKKHFSMSYKAFMKGPIYEVSIWRRKPSKPGGVGITVKLTAL